MVKRFVPRSSISFGPGKLYTPQHRQPDGTPGYTEDQVSGLSDKQLNSFRAIEIIGDDVEEATAAPGEKRNVSRTCDDCGYVAKSIAGLAAHQRSH